MKFGGKTSRPARKPRKISGKISETSFQISRLFSETSFSRRAVLIKFLLLFPSFRVFMRQTVDFLRPLFLERISRIFLSAFAPGVARIAQNAEDLTDRAYLNLH